MISTLMKEKSVVSSWLKNKKKLPELSYVNRLFIDSGFFFKISGKVDSELTK